MKIFLTLKHWQVFLIWIAGIFQLVFLIKTNLWFFSFTLYAGLMLAWIYSIGNILNKNDELKRRMNIWWILYLLALIPYAFKFRYMIMESYDKVDFWIIGPASIIGLIALFNIIIHTAKTLKATETDKKVKITDIFDEIFFLMSFYYGVWVLQTRLNKLMAKKKHHK